MDFLFYCRDKPGATPLLMRLTEAHWGFMDGYAERLLVRGPTLSEDGEEHTGSLHIVQLDSIADTETFAYQEPFYRAGAYEAVTIRRWHDKLGRAMRDFKPKDDDPLYLVLGETATPPELPTRHRDRLAAFGWTEALDGTAWTGFAAILQAPNPSAVGTLLAGSTIEIHRWCVGGRR